MPTYEYACDACGNDFEIMQKMSDDPVDACPKCGKKVRRVLSGGIGISFKGSGFYVNDASGKKKDAPSPACSGCPGK
jgi:putative FmdB family regulatory protein